MKNCYNCNGKVKKVVGSIVIEGVKIDDIPFEECQQCKERFYDEETAAFIQRVTNFVKEQRQHLLQNQYQ